MSKRIKTNTLYNENCLQTMAAMPDAFIDLCLGSPPYDNLRDYNQQAEFDFEAIAEELYRILKSGGVLVWIVGDATVGGNESGTSFMQALYFKEIGFSLFDTMIYAKQARGAVGNNTAYWQAFDYMFILSKGKPKSINLLRDRPNKESRKGDNGTKRLKSGELKKVKRGGYKAFGRRTNIWEYRVGKGHSTKDEIAFDHPAIFPEKLASDHILSWSNKGDLVYDPFMGSGTTAKMALLNGRQFIGSEISTRYYEISQERLKLYE